ncbi:MAG: hypothetical protein RIS64_4115 [Bacteroidota bacterium]|jgi:hypothetical protein
MNMFKKILFCSYCCALVVRLGAQVTPAQTLFQYSMTPFQPTALPYNYLDKFDRQRGGASPEKGHREDKKSLGWYLNASSRHEIFPETGVVNSGIVTADRISDPNQLGLKIGGGVMYSDLEVVQITSPFVHFSIGKALDDNWRLLGGLGYRFSSQRLNQLTYRDGNDPKIAIATDLAQSSYNVVGVSAAAVHLEKMYLGIGVNRILGGGQYAARDNTSFTETNLLFQYVLRSRYNANLGTDWTQKGSLRGENPNRGLFTNVNLSVAMRYLSAGVKYPLHAQINCRTTITPTLWTGMGWNTTNRWQIQVGLMKIPVFKMDASFAEYHIWIAYDVPTRNTPQHGVDLNLGYYF